MNCPIKFSAFWIHFITMKWLFYSIMCQFLEPFHQRVLIYSDICLVFVFLHLRKSWNFSSNCVFIWIRVLKVHIKCRVFIALSVNCTGVHNVQEQFDWLSATTLITVSALFSNNCIVKAFGWFLVFALSICFLSDSFPWVHTEWEHERNSTILYANISCLFYLHCVNCMKVLILIFTNAYIALNLLFTKRIYFCLLRNDISFQRKYENGQNLYSFNIML